MLGVLVGGGNAWVQQELYDMEHVVGRMVHVTREESLQHQRCDPLDDFRRCVDAVSNRHGSNVASALLFFSATILNATLIFACVAVYNSSKIQENIP